MATCSPILIGRLSIDKTDPTVIDLHTDLFSNTVRKFGHAQLIHGIGDPPLSALSQTFIGYSSVILTDFYCCLSFFFYLCTLFLSFLVLFVICQSTVLKSYRDGATAFCLLTSTISY